MWKPDPSWTLGLPPGLSLAVWPLRAWWANFPSAVSQKPQVFVSQRRGVLLGLRGLSQVPAVQKARLSPPRYSECKNLRGLRAYKSGHLASFSWSLPRRVDRCSGSVYDAWKPACDSQGGQWGAAICLKVAGARALTAALKDSQRTPTDQVREVQPGPWGRGLESVI